VQHPMNSSSQSQAKSLANRIRTFRETEAKLDLHIEAANLRLRDMVDQCSRLGVAFVSQDEIRALPSVQQHTVIAIRAPPGTTLEVPGQSTQCPCCVSASNPYMD
jgi:hypothetical protein